MTLGNNNRGVWPTVWRCSCHSGVDKHDELGSEVLGNQSWIFHCQVPQSFSFRQPGHRLDHVKQLTCHGIHGLHGRQGREEPSIPTRSFAKRQVQRASPLALPGSVALCSFWLWKPKVGTWEFHGPAGNDSPFFSAPPTPTASNLTKSVSTRCYFVNIAYLFWLHLGFE